jgi:hypothetical protein
MVSDALKALLSDEAQEIGYLVTACSQASMGNRESSGRRIANGCDCDKPSVGEEAQGVGSSRSAKKEHFYSAPCLSALGGQRISTSRWQVQREA